ncbi:hypothetical protein H0H81_006909 [Sphagnurus paluster]|uniref:Uncharacterized protein n=1 Tax=Sphagnurus paluster TaxID=117069 RepID=A0A9P7KIS5_9AGAR|nr:hypothetical protein H0H81_006909 [Sphagnurus paluster]
MQPPPKYQRRRATTLSAQTPRPVHKPAVFARLQNLFPPTQSQPNTPIANSPRSAFEKALPPTPPPKRALRALKGDLEELLGKVPLWSPTHTDTDGAILNLPLEAVHPYHLVVV